MGFKHSQRCGRVRDRVNVLHSSNLGRAFKVRNDVDGGGFERIYWGRGKVPAMRGRWVVVQTLAPVHLAVFTVLRELGAGADWCLPLPTVHPLRGKSG